MNIHVFQPINLDFLTTWNIGRNPGFPDNQLNNLKRTFMFKNVQYICMTTNRQKVSAHKFTTHVLIKPESPGSFSPPPFSTLSPFRPLVGFLGEYSPCPLANLQNDALKCKVFPKQMKAFLKDQFVLILNCPITP